MNPYAPKPQKSRAALGTSLCLLTLAAYVFAGGLWAFSGRILWARAQTAGAAAPPSASEPQGGPENDPPARQPQQPKDPFYGTGEREEFLLSAPPGGEGLSVEEITARVKPSVTGVACYDKTARLFGAGSGVIFRADGYIVTNYHVVDGAFKIRVTLDNGRGYEARLVGKDAASDLAVLKIEAEGLTAAQFGDSDEVAVGSLAVAIGNANGFHNSVTQGIFSGLNRQVALEMEDGNTYTYTLLQTDAAINPGNSGGALANKYGQVVGINSSKISAVDYEGMGFAIPSQIMKPVIEDLMAYGEVQGQARLGVVVTPMEETPKGRHAPETGVLIIEVDKKSGLLKEGVSAGDIIVSAAGRDILVPADLTSMVSRHRAGDHIAMTVYFTALDEVRELDVCLYDGEKAG